MNLISDIPKDLNLKIQNHFDINSATNYLSVSKSCYQWLSTNIDFWQKIYPGVLFPEKIYAKDCLQDYVIKRNFTGELLKRIEIFVNKLLLEQTGSFTCVIPNYPDCHFKLELNLVGVQRLLKQIPDTTPLGDTNSSEKKISECCIVLRNYAGYYRYLPSIKVEITKQIYSISAVLPQYIRSEETKQRIQEIVEKALWAKGISCTQLINDELNEGQNG